MKRVLFVAAAAAAAFATVPAHASSAPGPLTVTVNRGPDNYGVGTSLPGQPLWGVNYNTTSNKLCTGFSYQIPFCVVVPVEVG